MSNTKNKSTSTDLRMFRLSDGLYEYSEAEVNSLWAKWKKNIKACRYRCPLPECDWKPKPENEWQQIVEHVFSEHLTCPWCFHRADDCTSFAVHLKECKAKASGVSPEPDDIPF